MGLLEEFWENQAKEGERMYFAACRAVGSSAFLFSIGCDLTDAERLEAFADIFRTLATVLGLDDPTPPRATSAQNTTATVKSDEAE